MTRKSVWRRKLKSGRSRSKGRRRPRLDKLRLMQRMREMPNVINDHVVAMTEVISTAAMPQTIETDSDRIMAHPTEDAETEKEKQGKPMSTSMNEGIRAVTICLRVRKFLQQVSVIGTSSKIEGEYKFRVLKTAKSKITNSLLLTFISKTK